MSALYTSLIYFSIGTVVSIIIIAISVYQDKTRNTKPGDEVWFVLFGTTVLWPLLVPPIVAISVGTWLGKNLKKCKCSTNERKRSK